jgi:hypothetical protein
VVQARPRNVLDNCGREHRRCVTCAIFTPWCTRYVYMLQTSARLAGICTCALQCNHRPLTSKCVPSEINLRQFGMSATSMTSNVRKSARSSVCPGSSCLKDLLIKDDCDMQAIGSSRAQFHSHIEQSSMVSKALRSLRTGHNLTRANHHNAFSSIAETRQQLLMSTSSSAVSCELASQHKQACMACVAPAPLP